jgi:oligopeptide transport system ATP-binding protein
VPEPQASDVNDRTSKDVAARDVLLDVRDLRTTFLTEQGPLRAVDGVTFQVSAGETVGLVGESGSGKSVTALTVLRLLPSGAPHTVTGAVRFGDLDLLGSSERTMRHVRGRRIAMIFQDPSSALNPMLTIGRQLTEGIQAHLKLKEKDAFDRSVELLGQVGITAPRSRMSAYPHQLSGGMRQRVMIAMAVSCEPDLVLADEPTTALDVTIQAQILELLAEMAGRLGLAMVLITHNLGVVANFTSRTLVMYAGRVVEEAPTRELFRSPRHPYTLGLLKSIPRLDRERYVRLTPIEGIPPDPLALPRGCPFAPRCPHAIETCHETEPVLESVSKEHLVSCWVKP